jgi:hypothetical protein
LAKNGRVLANLLVQFIFAYIENTYFSGAWWESLSEINREHIAKLATMSNPYYTNFKYSPSLTFVPWEITNVIIV